MRRRFTSLGILSMFLMGGLAYAQVKGVLKDSNGFPMEEAEVIVTRTGTSVFTDGNGNFNVDAKVGDTLKIIDSNGEEKIVKVTSTTLGEVKFTSKASENIELGTVNLVGGIKMDAAQKIGAYDIVKKEDFELAPTASIDEVLNGRVAGLVFSTNSGDPGSANIITIRGVGSLYGTPNPLYVIDGVVVGKGSDNASVMESWNPLASIDPNAIENVSVLKDASATALYGSRGANGVIVITTKKGRYNQKTRFNVSSDMAYQDIAFDEQKFMTSSEYIQWGALANMNTDPGYAANMSEAIARFAGDVNWDGKTSEDWRRGVMRNFSSVNTYNFSAAGGSENTSFRIGGSYYQNRPLPINSKFDRMSVNLALDHKISDVFKMGFNGNFSNATRTSIDDGGAYRNPWRAQFTMLPIYPIYNADGGYNQNLGGTADNFNPVAILNTDFVKGNIRTYLSSINGELQFVKNFYLFTLFGLQYQDMNEKTYWDPSIADGLAQADPARGLNGGLVEAADTRAFDWNWQNSVSYRNIINDRHDLQVYAGMEYQEHKWNNTYAYVRHLSKPKPYLGFGATRDASSERYYKWAQISYFSRLNYVLDGKYTVSGQLRYDSNSTLGSSNRGGTFWSVGGSWNILKDFSNLPFSQLLFRANYGEIGNIPYADQTSLAYNSIPYFRDSFYGESVPANYLDSAGNKDLEWEVSKQWNFGLDFGILKDRLNFSVDVYNKVTTSAIWYSTIAQENGNPSAFLTNVGELTNKGVELTVNARPIDGNFKWGIYGNFAYNDNTVTKLGDPDMILRGGGNNLKALKEGKEFLEYYIPLWAGVDPETGAGLYWVDETKTATTTNRSEAKSVWMGKSSFPKYTAGFKNDFNFKGFNLSVFFTGQFDYYVNNMWQNFVLGDGSIMSRNQITSALYDSWTPDNRNASNPKQIVGNPSGSEGLSSRWVRKGDHIRLKEVKVSYTFKSPSFIKNSGLEGLTVYMKGVNMWVYTFDKKLDFDPESNSNAYSGAAGKGAYDYTSPIMKSISMGVSLDF
ncbi:SusC/RagA family TonB-linked outer membrane protein [Empedobacter brevis]|uniref:SusC/RagA family TonB-linked outer membrane protein n=1 Tax=Empedobacter brevis TaxID=247 RepID=UPI0021AA0AA4|nr:SusC/RagA family TonB-linked outer membrane protein [Empedobacter brevis]